MSLLFMVFLVLQGGCVDSNSNSITDESSLSDQSENQTRISSERSKAIEKAWNAYRQNQYERVSKILKPYRDAEVRAASIPHLLARSYYHQNRFSDSHEQWSRALPYLNDPALRDTARQFRALTRKLSDLRMKEFQYNHFRIFVPSSLEKSVSNRISHHLNRAYQNVGGDLNHYPERPFTVIIYEPGPYRRVIRGPIWSSGMFDGKIHVKYSSNRSEPYSPRTLVHEYTHALIHSLTRDNIPLWFNEGLATFEEYRQTNQEFRYSLLPEHRPRKTIQSLSDINQMYYRHGEQNDIRTAYEFSYSLIQFMKERYGLHTIKRILEKSGEKSSFNDAIVEIINRDMDRLQYSWENWIDNNF